MAELVPCVACRRHVSIDERVCPFCQAVLGDVAPQRIGLVGRVSRAAVFASATLATACGPAKKSNVPAPQQLPDAAVKQPDEPKTSDQPPETNPKPDPEPSPAKMPYGAPPARRRVV